MTPTPETTVNTPHTELTAARKQELSRAVRELEGFSRQWSAQPRAVFAEYIAKMIRGET